MNVEATCITCTLVAVGMRTWKSYADNDPARAIVRPLLAGTLLAGTLLLIANWWPEGALMLAMLVAGTSIVMNGTAFLNLVTKLIVK